MATETSYQLLDDGHVRPVRETRYHPGEVCVSVDRDIHVIRNLQAGRDLITLHLYTPPLSMNFYEPAPGLEFWS